MSDIDCQHWFAPMLEAEREENAHLRRELKFVTFQMQKALAERLSVSPDVLDRQREHAKRLAGF